MSHWQAFGMMLCFPLAASVACLFIDLVLSWRERLWRQSEMGLPHDYGKK